LDFKKIKQKERDNAKLLFKTREGKTQLKDIQRKAKTFVPGAPLPEATNKNTNAAGLTPEQVTFSLLLAVICALIVNVDCSSYKILPLPVSFVILKILRFLIIRCFASIIHNIGKFYVNAGMDQDQGC
jgi:hypothetical protein